MITVRISYITDISVSYIYPFIGLPWWLNVKNLPVSAGDAGSTRWILILRSG